MTGSAKCLIVDDHAAIRAGLGSILEDEDGIEIVGESGDGDSAVSASASLDPNVILMDVRMPGLDGFDATRQIIAKQPRMGICLYTAYRDAGMLTEGLGCGARGYLLKSTPGSDILRAVRQVAAGGLYVDAMLAGELVVPAQRPKLSLRECEVLTLLSTGLNNPAIGRMLFISPETVRTHITNAMFKLDADTRTHAVALAIRYDYITLN